jgi:ABC-type glycerol-3-phosphate transport system substrate-binding protein
MHIVIGNWWSNYNVDTYVPANENDEKTLEWRKKIQTENNFTMEEKNIAGWGEMAQLSATSTMAGDPAATVFVLQGDWAMAMVRQGLAYPVSDNTAVNLRNPQPVQSGVRAPEWNPATLDTFTVGGKTYAFSVGINMSNTPLVFFNKRLFREAGIDPDLPYNMQRDGTWTWDAFLDLSRRLTRDINNDGIMDTYAMPQDFSTAILEAAIASNDATYVDKDSTGRFVNATQRPEFIEGLQYAIRLNTEGVMKPKPDGANWDWFKSEFIDGNVAMRIEDSYIWGELQNMRDDWGIVFFPKGPRASTYIMYTRENVLVVPATFTAEQVNNIMTALALWYTPVTDDWKSGYYNTFRDARAVDETLALMRNTSIHRNKNYVLIPGLNTGNIAWSMWGYQGEPAQLVESVAPNWNTLIAEVNNDLSGR